MPHDPFACPDRQQQTERATEQGEQNALNQGLLQNPPARRAQGHTNGHFFATSSSPRQQQIGHVGARDKQDKGDRAEQH